MSTKNFLLATILGSLFVISVNSCIDNNNKDNDNSSGRQRDSDYRNEAPTYNKTEEDMEEANDTVASDQRVPKDPVEIKSKGNAASK